MLMGYPGLSSVTFPPAPRWLFSALRFVVELEALERRQPEKTEDPRVQTERKVQFWRFTQASHLDLALGLGWSTGGEVKIDTTAMKSLGEQVHRQKGTWFCFFETRLY